MTSNSATGGAVGSYIDRYRHFLSLTDPRTMAPGTFFGMVGRVTRAVFNITSLQTLTEARSIVDGKSSVITAKDRVIAKRIVQASVHPDTGEVMLIQRLPLLYLHHTDYSITSAYGWFRIFRINTCDRDANTSWVP